MNSELKRFLIPGVLIGAVHSASFGQDSLSTGSMWAGAVGIEYSVATNDLPARAEWNPDGAAFPGDLGKLGRAAEGFVEDARQLGGTVQHPAGWFELVDIEIFQIPPRAASGKYLAWVTNQWAIKMSFFGRSSFDLDALKQPAKKCVVLLPDGTRAAEKLVQSKKAKVVLTNSLPLAHSEPGIIAERHVSKVASNSLSWLTLPICPVQWDPLAQEFPLDLKRATSRAKEQILSVLGTEERLDLKLIDLMHYVPIETLKAAKLPASEHQHHWVLTFTFVPRLHNVYMMLDGTILPNSTQPPRTPRSTDN